MSGGRQARRAQEALTRGADHHRAGRWAEAARAYAEALGEEPGNVDALALLGGVALRMERPGDALAVLERAIALEPAHAVARLNQGRALLALERAADAEAAFAAALLARPDFPEALLGRARALALAGRLEEAIVVAGSVGVGSVEALALLGALLMEAGRFDEAEAPIRRALLSRSSDARLHADLGACLLARGEEEAAATAWRTGAALAPDLPGLLHRRAALARNIGLARLAEGSPAAVEWLAEAVRLGASAPDPLALLGLADALFQHPNPPAHLAPELCQLLAADGIDHQRIERAVRRVLREVPGVSTFVDGPVCEDPVREDPVREDPAREAELDTDTAEALAAHPLFTRWLDRTIVATPGWTRLVDALRGYWSHRALSGAGVELGVLTALATQAWHTEYASVDAASDSAPDAPAEQFARRSPSPSNIAAFAMFRPLARWPDSAALVTAPEPLATLIRAQLAEPSEEAALARALPTLGALTDPTSRAVRDQYEENPYPRLVGVHRRAPGSFVATARVILGDSTYEGPRRVLVAGGGTGQHPISVAAGLRGETDAEVVCVDLSRASLGRAARLAAVHGVTNLRFVQGDLLALEESDGLGTFDFVDCVGVLHHLADPLAGGRALLSKLAPGGILRLGLYSERGRSEIVAARALAAEHGWLPTDEGLRTARRALLALAPEHPAALVTASVDFYTQSGLRDLVFHPCEHRYTPAQVGALLACLGLTVVALQHARPEALRLYRDRWPADAGLDLLKWDQLEADHPRIFAGMIHVWARRA
ncbi:MAG: tetratricopeptide repeat protein [Pseudomonadota bacterium]|nr:tetratricopeptide repeat protein [Pseudomonadota bacterium]